MRLSKEHGISIIWVLIGKGEPVYEWWEYDDVS